ncbi:MAG: hypothetical protein ACRDPB_03270 [Nocardioidaceae bacterium]
MTHHHVPHVGVWERTHVSRSRGSASGIALILLGIWGGLIPFVGPLFGYAYTPSSAWTYTTARLYLEILPGIAVILGGLLVLGTASRAVGLFGGWLAALGGAWFTVGPVLAQFWMGTNPAGAPTGTGTLHVVAEQIGFFTGLGVVVVFFAALALGRTSVVAVRDLRPVDEEAEPLHRHDERVVEE